MNAHPAAAAVLAALALSIAAPGYAASLEAAAQAAVETSTVRPDHAVQEQVKAALVSDPALRGAHIAISTRDGEVTLAGMVIDERQRQRARKVAASIDGVRKVDDALEIQAAH